MSGPQKNILSNNLITPKIHVKERFNFYILQLLLQTCRQNVVGKRSAIELALHSPAAWEDSLVKTKGISIFPCSFGHRHFLHATT